MRLKGYILPFKENSFTIPVYGDDDSYFFHSVNESLEIIDFYLADFSKENFKQVYLSKQFDLGSIGVLVFNGVDYISYDQADKNIEEIINYLNDTTLQSSFINIKAEALEIKNILQKFSNPEISKTEILETTGYQHISSVFTFELPIYKQEPHYVDFEKFVPLLNETVEVKENVMKRFLQKFILDKNLFSSNKETFFHLLRKYLEENENVIEEIITDNKIGKGFSSFLTKDNSADFFFLDFEIEDTLRLRADERRKKLKEFNYRFHSNFDRITEIKDIPVYNKLDIELIDVPPSSVSSNIIFELKEFNTSVEQQSLDSVQIKNES